MPSWLGVPELIVILIIILVIFGPKRLPEIGRSLGKGIQEFKKSTNDFQEQLTKDKSAPQGAEKAAPQAAVAAEPQAAPEPQAAEAKSPETKSGD